MATLSILTPGVNNAKTAKAPEGYDKPVVNDLLHLAPANMAAKWAADDAKWAALCAYADRRGWGDKLREYGQQRAARINVCASASDGCRAACLNISGKGEMPMDKPQGFALHLCRVARTLRYYADREGFLNAIRSDIRKRMAECAKVGAKYVCRLNGTSDLPGLALQMASEFPEVMFYDYTKHPRPWLRERENYRITFSRSEENERDCLIALQHGVNVAVAFHVKRGHPLPSTYLGVPVIDGDTHDHRWLDPRGVVVGLRAKGKNGRSDTSGFIVECVA